VFWEQLIKANLKEWADKLVPEDKTFDHIDLGYVGDDLDVFQTPAGLAALNMVGC
jgi:hypothetical protein